MKKNDIITDHPLFRVFVFHFISHISMSLYGWEFGSKITYMHQTILKNDHIINWFPSRRSVFNIYTKQNENITGAEMCKGARWLGGAKRRWGRDDWGWGDWGRDGLWPKCQGAEMVWGRSVFTEINIQINYRTQILYIYIIRGISPEQHGGHPY